MDLLAEILKMENFKKYDKIKDFQVDTYKDSDFDNLEILYKTVFPHVKFKNHIEWKNRKNPFGDSDDFTFIMKDKEKIISQYAVIPKLFLINGKEYKCVQSLGTMTHPEYRGLGIFPYLAKISYEYARRKGYSFVYGFPNKYSCHGFQNRLNWIITGKINLFYKNIPPKIQYIKNGKDYIIQEIEEFDNKVDDLWNKLKSRFSIIIKKNKDYLNWRYIQHPSVKYKCFLVYDKKNNELRSFFVLKRYKENKDNTFGHIVDIFIDPSNIIKERELFKVIENCSCNKFKMDCSKISFWLPNENLKDLVIKNLNYEVIPINTYFGFEIFEKNEQFNLFKNQAKWNITMGDSDVF